MTPERVGDAGGRKRPVDPVLVRAVRQIIRLPLAPGAGVPKLLGRVSGSTAFRLEPVSVRVQNAGRAPAHAEIALHGAPEGERRQAGRANPDRCRLRRDGGVNVGGCPAEVDHDDIGGPRPVGARGQKPCRAQHRLGRWHDDGLVELLGVAQSLAANDMADEIVVDRGARGLDVEAADSRQHVGDGPDAIGRRQHVGDGGGHIAVAGDDDAALDTSSGYRLGILQDLRALPAVGPAGEQNDLGLGLFERSHGALVEPACEPQHDARAGVERGLPRRGLGVFGHEADRRDPQAAACARCREPADDREPAGNLGGGRGRGRPGSPPSRRFRRSSALAPQPEAAPSRLR